jgi:RNA polymerase sigma-70 factor (ECF subfamily)
VDELVERARSGDRDAFEALVQLTSDRMYAIAARILRDADLAEDALQGALIAAWKSLPTLRDPARFEAWLRRPLVNACYAEARRRRSWTTRIRVLPVDGRAGAPFRRRLLAWRRPVAAGNRQRPGLQRRRRRGLRLDSLGHRPGPLGPDGQRRVRRARGGTCRDLVADELSKSADRLPG